MREPYSEIFIMIHLNQSSSVPLMFSPGTGKSGFLFLETTIYLHFAGLNWSKLTSDHMYINVLLKVHIII